MAVGLVKSCVLLATLFTFVATVTNSKQDENQWLYKLVSSLKDNAAKDERVGKGHNQYWKGMPYFEFYNDMPLLAHITDLRQMFETSKKSGTNKKSYNFDRLLCCNHPPTKPPTLKRFSEPGDKIRNIALSNPWYPLEKMNADKNQLNNTFLDFYWPEMSGKIRTASMEAQPGVWDYNQASNDEELLTLDKRREITEAVSGVLQWLKTHAKGEALE